MFVNFHVSVTVIVQLLARSKVPKASESVTVIVQLLARSKAPKSSEPGTINPLL